MVFEKGYRILKIKLFTVHCGAKGTFTSNVHKISENQSSHLVLHCMYQNIRDFFLYKNSGAKLAYEIRYMYSKTCLKRPLKIDKTKVLVENNSLMEVESIAECSTRSILQYF